MLMQALTTFQHATNLHSFTAKMKQHEKRSFSIYHRDGRLQTIHSNHSAYDSLSYPLYHPYGTLGT